VAAIMPVNPNDEYPFSCASFSPDGQTIAIGSEHPVEQNEPGQVLLWDVKSGKKIAAFDGHSSGLRCLAFSPNGKMIASAGVEVVRGEPFGE
jgi:WD40 repeat protein